MSIARVDQYPDQAAPLPADAIVLLEINPDNAGTRAYRRGTLASLVAKAGLVTGSGLTMNTAKILARLTAAAGAVEELDFLAGSWTPAGTFPTPGTWAPTYATQTGTFFKLGQLVWVTGNVDLTANAYAGASGSFRVTGLPYPVFSAMHFFAPFDMITSSVAWPTGTQCLFTRFTASQSYAEPIAIGNGAVRSGLPPASFPASTQRVFQFSGFYRTSAAA